jgi:hypothetical protein
MGKHYVPQAYLRNFQVPDQPGFVWLYDKRGGEPHTANIAKIVQCHDYYSPETEATLAREVEIPGNQAMEGLLQGELLSSLQRDHLSFYIAVMLMRGPYRRRRAHEMYPQVLAETIAGVRSDIVAAASAADATSVAPLLAQIEEIAQRWATIPPSKVEAKLREPWPYQRMVDAIGDMAWRVLETSGPCYFITSDNPVYFNRELGLGLPESELCFPLSTTRALHGCQQGLRGSLTFVKAPQQLVKDVNRRLATTTEHLAFYHEQAPWLPQVLSKKHPYLPAISWPPTSSITGMRIDKQH